MEKKESGQWESMYTLMFCAIPPTLRDYTCEKLIELYSEDYSLNAIETFASMGEGVNKIEEDYVPELFVAMGYFAAYILFSRETAIMMCRQYCELRNVRHTSSTNHRFIVEDASIHDALFDNWGFLKPLNTNPNGQGML